MGRSAEGDFEDVSDAGGEFEFEEFADFGADFGEVFAVAFGEDDGFDAGALGGDGFFLDSADGEDESAEGDFAGHGDVGAGGAVGEEGGECGVHGDAGGGAVFGDGTGGDVDVDVGFGKEVFGDAEREGVVFEKGESGLGGFFHDVADLAGEQEVAFAGHLGGFDEEDFSADGGVGEAGDDAGGGGALGEFGFELGGAEIGGEVVGGDGDGFGDY